MESMDGPDGCTGKLSMDDVLDMCAVLGAWQDAEVRAQKRANKSKKSNDDDDDD